MTKNKDKGGRPPIEIDPEWYEKLIEHMGQGFSYESFAGVIGHAKETLYNIERRDKRFLDAKKRGFAKCQYWWENVGRMGMLGIAESRVNGEVVRLERFNAASWIFNMKNRFGWTDKREIDMRGDDSDAREDIRFEDSLSEQEIRALKAALREVVSETGED